MNRADAASSSNYILPVGTPEQARRCVFALVLFFVGASGAAARLHARAATSFPPSSQTSLTPLQREIEHLRARLSSSDTEDRREAVTRLGAMARADSSRAALPALKDAAVIVRATAARAILSLPATEAAAALLPLLADKDEFVRRETAYALGETRSRTAVEALATALARDKEAGVRGAAAVALGQIGDPAALPSLRAALATRDPYLSEIASEAIRKLENGKAV